MVSEESPSTVTQFLFHIPIRKGSQQDFIQARFTCIEPLGGGYEEIKQWVVSLRTILHLGDRLDVGEGVVPIATKSIVLT